MTVVGVITYGLHCDSCHVSMWLDILLPKVLVFVVAAAPAFGQILHGVILTIRGV